ncbi:phosphatidylserine decarboxylase [Pseudomonadota bacterium]
MKNKKKCKCKHSSIVIELKALIKKHHWKKDFKKAIRKAHELKLPIIGHIKSLKDYYNYLDDFIHWTPKETKGDSRLVYDHLVAFYFFMQYPSVRKHQSPITPHKPLKHNELTPLSKWIVKCANAWGAYLDTTESAKEIKTFKDDPWFNWDEYMAPPSGYLTFNEFFARHTKPGMRPIAGLNDDSVIVSQADCTMVGWWQIGQNSNIHLQQSKTIDHKPVVIRSKIFTYSIEELLKDSKYADRFKGGIFMHSFLNSTDYHRWNSPVGGKVLESRVIQGQAYLGVEVDKMIIDGKERNHLSAVDGTGYQFFQTRGLIVIDSPFGLVACLPMGMAQVSSVTITAEEGVTLRKGEELGYFKFGGSDFVMCFERSSSVQITTQPNEHVQQGMCIGNAYPYSMR